MSTILTVTANTLLDHLTTGAVVPRRVTRVDRFAAAAGGKGLNMGRVLARHGHRVVATGFAGGPTGAMLVDLVAADGMEPAFVTTAARTRLGFLCVEPDGGNTSVLEGGFAVTAAELGALVAQVRRLLAGCDLCLVGGSVPDATCTPLFRLILAACEQARVPCWIDAYGPAMDEALASPHPPALVKPNREEYGEDSHRWLPAHELHLTDGGGEIRVRHPDGRFRVTPPPVPEANPIGSGDCYLAALAHARLSGHPLEQQLRYAAAAGAANAARADVAAIGPRDIEALVDAVRIAPAEA